MKLESYKTPELLAMIEKIKLVLHGRGEQCSVRPHYHDGEQLRIKRLEAGMGLRQMSRDIGCSDSYLCNIEAGRNRAPEWIKTAYGLLSESSDPRQQAGAGKR